jgi:hypothetical protein
MLERRSAGLSPDITERSRLNDEEHGTRTQDRPPANVREFRRRLLRLDTESGRPSHREIDTIGREYGSAVAKATLSEFRNDRSSGLPRWDFVRAVVAGGLVKRGLTRDEVTVHLDTWHTWWKELVIASGQPLREAPAAKPAPPADVPAPAPARRRPWLLVAIAAITAGAVGFGAGALVFGRHLPWSADPSLQYGPCAEQVGHSTQVGSVALLFEEGPPGKPLQDRRVELRVQKHPIRGWIAWAYLQKTASPLDRLWLDWSYLSSPIEQSQWRQCGAQPISEGSATPGLLATDSAGQPRWFRACGQAPTQDRAPDRTGTFCTSWTRPAV